MILIPHKRSGRILVALFTLPLFLSSGFQRVTPLHNAGRSLTQAVLTRETIPAGDEQSLPGLASRAAATCSNPARKASSFGANGPLNIAQVVRVPIPVKAIVKSGPVIPLVLSMNSFNVTALVKGAGWVILVDYELEPESTATVTLVTRDQKPFTFQLQPADRKEVIRELPFSNKPEVGVIDIQAFKNDRERRPAHFTLLGLAVGDRGDVVGSMVIDQLKFGPTHIRPKLKEKASYSFRSRSDFDTVSVDFRRMTLAQGVVTSELAASETLKKGVRPGEFVTKFWDGKNSKGKASVGRHQFFVRGWRGLKSGGDWVFAAADQTVTVE